MRDWIYRNWMYAGFIAGLFLFAIMPVLGGAMSLALLLVFLQLPVYQLHQLEEHAGDRFRRFANEVMAGGKEALTTPAVVFINIFGVWVMNLMALYLARFVELGLGLIAVYLTLVNAVTHIAAGIVLRRYNPGLATAILLFLPVGLYALVVLSETEGVTMADQAIGLAVAILIHAGIIVYVRRRVREV